MPSPAEFFAELVWQANVKLEQTRAKKRAARMVRRWAQLVRGAWEKMEQKHLDDARNLQRFRYETEASLDHASQDLPILSRKDFADVLAD